MSQAFIESPSYARVVFSHIRTNSEVDRYSVVFSYLLWDQFWWLDSSLEYELKGFVFFFRF